MLGLAPASSCCTSYPGLRVSTRSMPAQVQSTHVERRCVTVKVLPPSPHAMHLVMQCCSLRQHLPLPLFRLSARVSLHMHLHVPQLPSLLAQYPPPVATMSIDWYSSSSCLLRASCASPLLLTATRYSWPRSRNSMLLLPTVMLWMMSPWSLITLSRAWITAMKPAATVPNDRWYTVTKWTMPRLRLQLLLSSQQARLSRCSCKPPQNTSIRVGHRRLCSINCTTALLTCESLLVAVSAVHWLACCCEHKEVTSPLLPGCPTCLTMGAGRGVAAATNTHDEAGAEVRPQLGAPRGIHAPRARLPEQTMAETADDIATMVRHNHMFNKRQAP